MIERRQTLRRRTLLTGRIEFLDRSVFDCVVRNLSDDGAQIRCDQQVALPDIFRLVIEKKGERRPVRAVWRSRDEIGLQFLTSEKLGNLLLFDGARDPLAQ